MAALLVPVLTSDRNAAASAIGVSLTSRPQEDLMCCTAEMVPENQERPSFFGADIALAATATGFFGADLAGFTLEGCKVGQLFSVKSGEDV
jgi:hypothetical protein